MNRVFPNGALSLRINTFPGTNHRLENHFRIFVSKYKEPAPANSCIKHKFGLLWAGNVVVAKYARRDSDILIHIDSLETDMIDALVEA